MDEWVYLVAALAAGFLLGVLVILPFAIRKRRQRANAPSRADEDVVPMEVVTEDEAPAPAPAPASPRSPPPASASSFDDHPFTIVKARPPMRGVDRPAQNVPESAIPMEWAQRHEGGPAPEGRVRGACSGCGSKLTITNRKPLRIACPVCGRTRLIT